MFEKNQAEKEAFQKEREERRKREEALREAKKKERLEKQALERTRLKVSTTENFVFTCTTSVHLCSIAWPYSGAVVHTLFM